MRKLQLLAIFLATSFLWSCDACPDEFGDYDDGVQRQGFSPSYEHSPNNWQPVVGAFGYIHIDSVKLYNQDYTLVEDFVVQAGGNLSFPYVYPNTPKEENITKTYYLYLSFTDIDTIRQEYKIEGSYCKLSFHYGRFFYNNKLITFSTDNKPIPYATFNKY